MKILVLEDMETRINYFKQHLEGNNLTIVSTAKDAIDILDKDLEWDYLFLDHDLGNKVFVDINMENTGSTVAKFLSDKNITANIIIHSWNPVGAQNMLYYLPKAKYIPIGSTGKLI